MASSKQAEAFPEFTSPPTTSERSQDDASPPANSNVPLCTSSSTASRNRRSRGQSLIHNILTGDTPLGVWQAIGEAGSKIPTLSEIRDGAFGDEGWSQEGQLQRRGTDPQEIHQRSSRAGGSFELTRSAGVETTRVVPANSQPRVGTLREEGVVEIGLSDHQQLKHQAHSSTLTDMHKHNNDMVDVASSTEGPDKDGFYPNGYRFPEKHTWSKSIAISLKAFWKFFITWKGFLFTVYCLNVVGWGAMIFFVLLDAAPAMCHPSCNDKYSARNVWIEIDAQILTALFCVPAFGLLPRRFRDFYLLGKWRLCKDTESHRKLAGIYRSWYRLPGSNRLASTIGPLPANNNSQSEKIPQVHSTEIVKNYIENPALPLPPQRIPDAPLTGVRAPPTKSWNLDIVIWMYVLNTWIQGALCGIMWGMNRFNRPSWATGLLISLGCVTGIVGGIVEFTRGSKIKKVEGIPVNRESDVEEGSEELRTLQPKDEAKAAQQKVRQVRADGTNS